MAKSAMERCVGVLDPRNQGGWREHRLTEWEMAAEASKVVLASGGREIPVFLGGNVPEDRPVKLDDILGYHMEMTGPSGHWCELTVTLAFRDPSPLELRLMEAELRAYEQMRRQARPGARLSDLASTLEQVYLEDGWQLAEQKKPHHDFHGQGVEAIEWPFWGTLDTDQDAVFEEGMCFS